MRDILDERYDNFTLEYKIYNNMSLFEEEIIELLNDDYDAEQDIQFLKRGTITQKDGCNKNYIFYQVKDKFFIVTFLEIECSREIKEFRIKEIEI